MADGLKRLLETEAELDATLEATRRQADEIVRTARARADGQREHLAQHLAEKEAALRRRLEAEHRQRLDAIRADAVREVERLDRLTDADVAALAEYVLSRVARTAKGGSS
jgi:hypothetical protein